MSLILEALRKSEAERRRGLTPDVFTELPPVAQRRVPALSARHWLLLALGMLMLSAALAWLLREHWLPSPATVTTLATETGTAALGASDATSPAAPPARDLATSTDSAANTTPGVVQVPIPAPTSSTSQAVEPQSVASQPAVPSPIVVPPVGPPTRQQTPPTAATVEADALPSVDKPPVAAPAKPPAAPMARTQATPASTPGANRDDTPLELSDLTAEQRRQLPPLKLSMHLWNKDPARRFVIIDGTRLGEGDRIGDAVIDRITADSVVLDWNGRSLRLPLR